VRGAPSMSGGPCHPASAGSQGCGGLCCGGLGVRDDMSVLRAGKERGLPRQRGADAMND
jgi:hypothetical protein